MSLLRWIVSTEDWVDEEVNVLYGTNEFVEYHPGNTNLIISIPHGGEAKPPFIKDRDKPVLGNHDPEKIRYRTVLAADSYTLQIGRSFINEYTSMTGLMPHVIKTNLHRSKLDVNRPREAALNQTDTLAEKVYEEYHNFIKLAMKQIEGRGLLLDIHGQNHKQNSTELGYLLHKSQLNTHNYHHKSSSVRNLAIESGRNIKDLICGQHSLGACLEDMGHRAVPSPRQPSPGEDRYFRGGYICESYGSRDSGQIDAIQIEIPGEIRLTGDENRHQYGRDLAAAIVRFMNHHYW